MLDYENASAIPQHISKLATSHGKHHIVETRIRVCCTFILVPNSAASDRMRRAPQHHWNRRHKTRLRNLCCDRWRQRRLYGSL